MMNAHARQRGALVVIAMVMLAGVAAMGGSLAKMQVSGMDAVAQHTAGNKSMSMAETAIQMGLKQFVDAECDPSRVTGATPEQVDGSTVITQNMGDKGSFKITFCPMDGTCYPDSLMPDDEDVNNGQAESGDVAGTYHAHWITKYNKHGRWFEWLAGRPNYRYHHWRHTDKREHWRSVQFHRKSCHGPGHPHHDNHNAICESGGTTSVEDSVNYWIISAQDANGVNKRVIKQMVSCESGPENTGNLFTGDNYRVWAPAAMINRVSGAVTFGTTVSGATADTTITAADGSLLLLPEDGWNDVWFHGTFKLPAASGDNLSFTFTVKDRWGYGWNITCGEKNKISSGINLTKNDTTIQCNNNYFGTTTYMKCDGTNDPECNISTGKLHFNMGKFDTSRVKSVKIKGTSTVLYDAFVGAMDGGVAMTAKPTLNIGKWLEDL
ncbi:MAG: hypothetical protein HQL95_08260 [Magnetococcales bacterium]|nr:hypothetical protein [Magnetococcales bacterium]